VSTQSQCHRIILITKRIGVGTWLLHERHHQPAVQCGEYEQLKVEYVSRGYRDNFPSGSI
jgi:hypothetical protein